MYPSSIYNIGIKFRYIFSKNETNFLTQKKVSVNVPPSADSRKVGVSYKEKYVHKVLVNCLVKLAQEKVWLG